MAVREGRSVRRRLCAYPESRCCRNTILHRPVDKKEEFDLSPRLPSAMIFLEGESTVEKRWDVVSKLPSWNKNMSVVE